MKIIKADEPLEIQNITLLINGQPGSGKTSMAFTSDKPLLIGFDEYIYRPTNRKDSIIVNSWNDIADISNQNLSTYNTIIVDTVGMGLFYLAEHLMQTNPKACKNQYTNTLSLNGWGQLKAEFGNWYRTIKHILIKDIIFIAHEKEEKDGDVKLIRPDIPGGTAGDILKIVDFAGYIFAQQKGINVIDFNTTERYIGKNLGQALGDTPIAIPNFASEPDFLAKLIVKMKLKLNEMNNRQKQSIDNLKSIFQEIENIKNVVEINKFYNKIKENKKQYSNGEAKQIREKLKLKSDSIPVIFDKDTNQFVAIVETEPKHEFTFE